METSPTTQAVPAAEATPLRQDLMVYCSLNLQDAKLVLTSIETLNEDVRAALLELGVRPEIEEAVIEKLARREFATEGRFLSEVPQRVCVILSSYIKDIADRIQLSIDGKAELWRSY